MLPSEIDLPPAAVTEIASVLAKGYFRYRASLRKPLQDRADVRLDPSAGFSDPASLGKALQDLRQKDPDQQKSRYDARHEPRHHGQHHAPPDGPLPATPAAQIVPPTSAANTGLAFQPKQSLHVTVVNAQRKGEKGKKR